MPKRCPFILTTNRLLLGRDMSNTTISGALQLFSPSTNVLLSGDTAMQRTALRKGFCTYRHCLPSRRNTMKLLLIDTVSFDSCRYKQLGSLSPRIRCSFNNNDIYSIILCVYVSMCVCMCVCVCVYVYMSIYVCLYMTIYVYLRQQPEFCNFS